MDGHSVLSSSFQEKLHNRGGRKGGEKGTNKSASVVRKSKRFIRYVPFCHPFATPLEKQSDPTVVPEKKETISSIGPVKGSDCFAQTVLTAMFEGFE